jgi:type I restriction enzyme S subunit
MRHDEFHASREDAAEKAQGFGAEGRGGMSVAPYPEYKYSGVEWIGPIPINWLPARLKDAARLKMGQSPPSEDYVNLEDGTPFLQGCAEFGEIHPHPRFACSTAQKFAEPGELLFSVRAPVGRMNVADRRYGIGRGLCAIKPHLLNHGFAFWLLDGLRGQLDAEATGSTFEAVSTSQVANIAIAIPPPEEQSAIAAFLYPSGESHLPFHVKPLSSVLMDDLKVAHKYGG